MYDRGLPRDARVAGNFCRKSRLKHSVAMNRHTNNLPLAGFGIDVMAAPDSLESPFVFFRHAAKIRALDRLHTATSRIMMFDSGSVP